MKKKKTLIGVAVILCVVFGAGVFVGAATSSAEPGSAGDPLITKSYLDERLKSIGRAESSDVTSNTELTALKKQIQELETKNDTLQKQLDEVKKTADRSNFKKATLKAGKSLNMKYGSEVIFYSGSATFKTGNNTYILDQTERKHVSNGANAVQYHRYLVRSSSDLVATKNTVVYVRGTFSYNK